MIIHSIHISSGEKEFKDDFKNLTHIWSKTSIQGKTTLIRFLIYGLGYNIPLTTKINKEKNKYKIKIKLSVRDKGFTLIREKNTVHIITDDNPKEEAYPVSKTNFKVLSHILGIDNSSILSNLLGSFYIDQENSWINRTKARGQTFNVDKLIFGLSEVDEFSLVKRDKVVNQITAYNKMIEIRNGQPLEKYIKQERTVNEDLIDIQQEIDELIVEKNRHSNIKKSAMSIKNQNENVLHYLESMNLTIKIEDKMYKFKRDYIVGLPESNKFIEERIADEEIRIKTLEQDIELLKKRLNELLSDRDIVNTLIANDAGPTFNIDIGSTKLNIGILKKEKDSLDYEINQRVKSEGYVTSMNKQLVKYSEKLGVSDILGNNPIQRSDFRDVAGTNRLKLVLAYRLTFLKTVSNYLGVKLPFIMDSIDEEIDSENLALVFKTIYDVLEGHQIIISTIRDIPGDPKKITVEGCLLHKKDILANVQRFEI